MELRRRNASQIAAMAEMAAGSDNDDPVEAQPSALPEDSDSDEEYGVKPSKPPKSRRKAPARRRIPAEHMRPDLVELVLGQMGRKDLFSKDTLKNLRQTSRGFKILLDELFSSLSNVFIRNNKGITELLKSLSTIQNMETFRFSGARPLEVCNAAALMAANPSQLKKLVLENAGLALDILVHCSLPNLTSLKITSLAKASKALVWLCSAENAWPLQVQELHLSSCKIDHTVFVPALKRLRQLRKLTLFGWIMSNSGRLNPEGFAGDCFPVLETLELLHVQAPNRLGLLSQASLPALRHLNVQCSRSNDLGQSFLTSLDAPWLQRLQSLKFSSQYRRGLFSGDASLLTAFHGGALKTLVITSWDEHDALFESVHLSGLTSLQLNMRGYYPRPAIPPRVMTPLATASLPLLSKLTIVGDSTLEEGDIKSLTAFIQLRSLSFTSVNLKESDWKWFVSSNVLSRLEEFATSKVEFITSIRALDLSTTSWPLMRKLDVSSNVLVNILPLALRFPSITALNVNGVETREERTNGLQPGEPPAHEVIIAAANEHAWPELKSLSLSVYSNYEGYVSVLERAWPKASIHGRH